MHDPSFQGERPLRLKKEVDTASVLWGDDWRMPTFEGITMLADMSKFTWTVSREQERTSTTRLPANRRGIASTFLYQEA